MYVRAEQDSFIGEPAKSVLPSEPPFRFDPKTKSFGVLFDAGLLNLVEEGTLCHLHVLFNQGWLDIYTKELCISVLVYNSNGDGRYALLRRCFSIASSGKIESTIPLLRSIGSAEAAAGYYTSFRFVVFCAYGAGVLVKTAVFLRMLLKQFQCSGLKGFRRIGTLWAVLEATLLNTHFAVIALSCTSIALENNLSDDAFVGNALTVESLYWCCASRVIADRPPVDNHEAFRVEPL